MATVTTALVMKEGAVISEENPDVPVIQVVPGRFHPSLYNQALSVYANGELLNLEKHGVTTYIVKGTTE